jgi:hypothetical protein
MHHKAESNLPAAFISSAQQQTHNRTRKEHVSIDSACITRLRAIILLITSTRIVSACSIRFRLVQYTPWFSKSFIHRTLLTDSMHLGSWVMHLPLYLGAIVIIVKPNSGPPVPSPLCYYILRDTRSVYLEQSIYCLVIVSAACVITRACMHVHSRVPG